MHRLHMFAAVLLVWGPSPSSAAAVTIPDRPVTIRVYDAAGLTDAERTAALAAAAASLRSASIAATWTICTPAAAVCAVKPANGELVLRLVHSTAAAPVASSLGDAHLNPHAGSVLATIYVDRVRRVANDARIDMPTLAGYAIAHELGHLLLESPAHSSRGLMRAVWSLRELRRANAADWQFTRQEARVIGSSESLISRSTIGDRSEHP